jgi:hypothetical protein
MNKKDELLNLINDKDYDVIALTEIYPKNIVDSNVSDIEFENERCILDLSKGLLQLSGARFW